MKKGATKLIKNSKVLILSVLAVIATAFIGSRFTKIDLWYESVKPSITPPNIVFPIVWTTLFILIAISMYLAISNSNKKTRNKIIILFAINLILNVLWSLLFFTMHNPIIAFIDLVLLWLSIIAIMVVSWKISKKASWLLLPYLLWVTFAGILNYLVAFG
jgi:tryptophan-rich sensory protein